MTALASHPATAALCVLGWALLASLLPFLRATWRPVLFWGLVVAGVPLLGWLTFLCGPVLGVIFLAAGLTVLVWPPFALLRRRRPGVSPREAQ
ncbi:DUF2484 family protein [Paracoccus ravus]|uniref:DUF2484 family protein n=1 Tax=Paracoccus ravus TaxID=2447760 RepID=UPI00106EBE51|nr:DUF2484 family protein [Paracoccus ravus]